VQPPVRAALPLLERSSYGAAVCAQDGTILARNETAVLILEAIAPSAHGEAGDEALHLPSVLLPALQTSDPEPSFFSAPGPRRIAVQKISPLVGQDGPVLLIFADLSARPRPAVDTLRRAFGLTRREARVASEVAAGLQLREIAALHGVGMGTVRSQLKAIFVKTGTNRQPDLVALLARLLPFG
jgi:DNA-binding CsgD family transcriptional regulator